MSGIHPHSQFHLARPTKTQQTALGKPTVLASAQIHSDSKVRNTTIYNEAAEPKPPSSQPAYPTINQFRSIQQRLDRHRSDLTELFDGTRKSVKTSDELQNSKNSLRKAEELCTIRCMNATMRISTLEHSNKALTTQVEALAAQVKALTLINTQPKCVDCVKAFEPAKKSYKKCPECFLSLKVKLCKNCSKPFTPKHHSFKYCPCCSRK